MSFRIFMFTSLLLLLPALFLAHEASGVCTDTSPNHCGSQNFLFGSPTPRAQFFNLDHCNGSKLDLDAPGEIADLRDICRTITCVSLWNNSITSIRTGCDNNVFGELVNVPAHAMVFEGFQFSGRCITIGPHKTINNLSSVKLRLSGTQTWNNRIRSIRTFEGVPPASELQRCPLV
jgi:hypothetical protein